MDWFTWKTATPEEMGDMSRHPPYGRELEDWRKNTDLNEYKNFEDLPKEALQLLELTQRDVQYISRLRHYA